MFKELTTAVTAVALLSATAAAQVDGTHQHEDAAEPSMDTAQGMMMGGMMGQG